LVGQPVHYSDGIEQVKAHRSITGRRYYTHEQYLQIIGQNLRERRIVSYCRVSSNGQKKDLSTQRDAVEAFCLTSGRIVHEKFEDIGSGLNYNRKNFIRLMEMVEQGALSSNYGSEDLRGEFGAV